MVFPGFVLIYFFVFSRVVPPSSLLDTHILQWMHGCESITEDGIVKFSEGQDTYSYDGENFLHFDDKNGDWVSSNPAAQDTKRKWQGVQTLKDYTKGYLENECLSWLNKFVEYGRKQHQEAREKDFCSFVFCFMIMRDFKSQLFENMKHGPILRVGMSRQPIRPQTSRTPF